MRSEMDEFKSGGSIAARWILAMCQTLNSTLLLLPNKVPWESKTIT